MRQWMKKLSKGQTTAEYAIIVALVAVSSIAIILIFGDQIRALFAGETQRLAQDTQVQVDTSAAGKADSAKAGSIHQF